MTSEIGFLCKIYSVTFKSTPSLILLLLILFKLTSFEARAVLFLLHSAFLAGCYLMELPHTESTSSSKVDSFDLKI